MPKDQLLGWSAVHISLIITKVEFTERYILLALTLGK